MKQALEGRIELERVLKDARSHQLVWGFEACMKYSHPEVWLAATDSPDQETPSPSPRDDFPAGQGGSGGGAWAFKGPLQLVLVCLVLFFSPLGCFYCS